MDNEKEKINELGNEQVSNSFDPLTNINMGSSENILGNETIENPNLYTNGTYQTVNTVQDDLLKQASPSDVFGSKESTIHVDAYSKNISNSTSVSNESQEVLPSSNEDVSSTKSNKSLFGLIFLFVFLGVVIFALPYITSFVAELKAGRPPHVEDEPSGPSQPGGNLEDPSHPNETPGDDDDQNEQQPEVKNLTCSFENSQTDYMESVQYVFEFRDNKLAKFSKESMNMLLLETDTSKPKLEEAKQSCQQRVGFQTEGFEIKCNDTNETSQHIESVDFSLFDLSKLQESLKEGEEVRFDFTKEQLYEQVQSQLTSQGYRCN